LTERFTLLESFASLATHYGARAFGGEDWRENYNIAPKQWIPVVVEEPDGLELRLMQWGLVPFWAKADKIGASMINAPIETLTEKPGFRDSFKDKRCIIPATGFYVWQKLSTVKKPYYVTGNGLLSFAGLWSRWVSPQGVELESCAIVTMPANEVMKPVSDRMPALLPKSAWQPWLAKATRAHELLLLLSALPAKDTTMNAVTKYVNAAKSNGAKCIAPADQD